MSSLLGAVKDVNRETICDVFSQAEKCLIPGPGYAMTYIVLFHGNTREAETRLVSMIPRAA